MKDSTERIDADQAQVAYLLQQNYELKEALATLKQTNTDMQNDALQFKALAQFSGDHLFILDRKGTYLYSNDNVSQFGLSRGAELIGRRLPNVCPHDATMLYREKVKKVYTDGQAVSFSHEAATGKGARYHLVILYPIYKEKHIWAVGGICRDMSAQRRIEKQLFQAQKMESLGTLVAGVAHEINNPINLMLFNLPLLNKMWRDLLPLLDSHPRTSENLKFGGLTLDFIKQNILRLITDMEMAANRVARIVKGLKGFSRKSNPVDTSDIQVNVAVENAARLASSTLSKSKTDLKVSLSPELPLLRANLQNLEQIILNLIINAHESIHHNKGCVRIETKLQENKRAIAIVVADNGRGINPAVADKIFDPFVTDRQSEGGTGLGLSVTYNLVKAHNGEITFNSKEGRGTEFTVSLPISKKLKPCRIMVVDDDASFRALLIQALTKKIGCMVEGFANGTEALIRLGSDPPDLLVLDMFMPEIDGLGVCRAIKNELGLGRMKAIIVTGFPDHPNLEEALRMGFRQIVTKPLEMDHFIDIVRNELNGISS